MSRSLSYAETMPPAQIVTAIMCDEAGGTVAKGLPGPAWTGDGTYSATGITFREVGPSTAIPFGVALDGSSGVITLPTVGFAATSSSQLWSAWVYSAAAIDSASSAKYIFGSTAAGPRTPLTLGAATSLLANEVVTIVNDSGGPDRRTGWSGFTIPAGWNHHAIMYRGGSESAQNNWFYYLNGVDITLIGGTKISNGGGCLGFDSTLTYTVGATGSTPSYSAFTVAGIFCGVVLSPTEVGRLCLVGKQGFSFA